jgi:hypothetical protein
MLEVLGEETPMPSDRPDPSEFLAAAQRMLRELFGDARTEEDPWAGATRESRESRLREPSPEEQRENLTFALATRAVEALEDLALNVAAIRQRLERTSAPADAGRDAAPRTDDRRSDGEDPTGE